MFKIVVCSINWSILKHSPFLTTPVNESRFTVDLAWCSDAKAKAEAQALIDEQTQAELNEEAQSVTSFALTGNLKTITLSRHEYPHKHEQQSLTNHQL
jgi:hypothetical protein